MLIDLDELREFHPDVERLRSTFPYTLSNGTWTSDLINDLQAKGMPLRYA